jgi:hypothetical protein
MPASSSSDSFADVTVCEVIRPIVRKLGEQRTTPW